MTSTADRLNAALAGRYVIERELGAGGMAVVYLARDLRHDRRVALKVLHPDMATTVGAERFLREITIAARLQHPNVVPVFDSGDSDGILWYAMAYVEGESLRARIDREGELPIDVALTITREVADAIDHAHAQGVVHRDIKPENILVSNGRALVVDFGIARAVHEEAARLTATGLAIGTPVYMSPEQASGEREVGPASDVYSLACVTFEMLTGEAPYTGASTRAIMTKRMTDPVPSARRLRAAVSPAMDAAIMRALSPVPADRPSTAGAFAQALSVPERERSLRRPLLAGAIGAILVVAAVLALQGKSRDAVPAPDADIVRARTLLAQRTPEAVREALARFQGALAKDSGSAEALAGVAYAYMLFADWGWELDSLTPAEMRARALDHSQRALVADSTSAAAWMSRAYVLVVNDPYHLEGAVAAFKRSLTLDSTTSEGWYQYGQALMQLGEDSLAADAYRRAFALDPNRPMALMSLSALSLKAGRIAEAKQLIDSAVAASPTVTSPYVRVVRGRIHMLQGDLRAARDEGELALAMDTTYTIPARSLLASVAWAEGRKEDALRELQRMRTDAGPGELSPTTARYLASALVVMGRHEEAVSVIERARPRGAYLWFYMQSPDFSAIGSNPRLQLVLREADPRPR